MTQAELSTAAQEGLKVNVAIINNGYLGMVRQWQEFFYERRYAATPLKSPDFVKIAEAHGLLGLRVDNRPGVNDIIKRARETEGTVLIDFRVEQEDSVYPMVPAGADLGRTAEPGISRMTIVIDSDQVHAERVTAYLYKLPNVLQVEDLGADAAVARDLALVKVAVAGHDRAALLRVVDETRAHIVDSGEQTMTLEITGEPPHVDAVIARLEPLGIIEMVRSGQVAMRRGDTALSAAG